MKRRRRQIQLEQKRRLRQPALDRARQKAWPDLADLRPNVYDAWLKDFMEAGKARLQADTIRDASRTEVEGFKRENERLKQLVAELSLEVLVLKKTAVPEFD